jgi:hypothetical protein
MSVISGNSIGRKIGSQEREPLAKPARSGTILKAIEEFDVATNRRAPIDLRIAKKQPKWRNGRRAGLKIRSLHGGVGSSPTFGTIDLRRTAVGVPSTSCTFLYTCDRDLKSRCPSKRGQSRLPFKSAKAASVFSPATPVNARRPRNWRKSQGRLLPIAWWPGL